MTLRLDLASGGNEIGSVIESEIKLQNSPEAPGILDIYVQTPRKEVIAFETQDVETVLVANELHRHLTWDLYWGDLRQI